MSEEELFSEWIGTGYGAYKINYKKEYEKLHSIIKEIREYITTHKLYNYVYDEEELFEIITDKKAKDELLKILEREVNDERSN